MHILEAIADPKVFGQHFRDADSWRAWRAFLAALFGLPMDAGAGEIFRACTGRLESPEGGASEAWLIIGRRGGKSFVLAVIAVFLACFRDWRPHLGPGERATVMVIAADRRQARVIIRYVKGLLQSVPMLARTVEGETADSVALRNATIIEVHTASFRTVRGYTVCAALLDELAFWPVDEASASQDVEIIAALRPAMASIPGALLLCASSPYARRGALYEAYRRHWGQAGKVLVWQAPTKTMNPTIPQDVIDQAYEVDGPRAAAEYGAEFRADVESYVSLEIVEACTVLGRHELPRLDGVNYLAAVDPSGGVSDSMTLCIAHRDGDRVVIDCIRERKPPFSPDSVAKEFAETLSAYGLHRVTSDRFGGEWPREAFGKYGVSVDIAEKSKNDIYGALLPTLNSGRVDLLDHAKLRAQLIGLERRTARGGKDSIDHAPARIDDIANCVGLVVTKLIGGRLPIPDDAVFANLGPRTPYLELYGPKPGEEESIWDQAIASATAKVPTYW